jgi:hypothetical protein
MYIDCVWMDNLMPCWSLAEAVCGKHLKALHGPRLLMFDGMHANGAGPAWLHHPVFLLDQAEVICRWLDNPILVQRMHIAIQFVKSWKRKESNGWNINRLLYQVYVSYSHEIFGKEKTTDYWVWSSDICWSMGKSNLILILWSMNSRCAWPSSSPN